MNTMRAPTHNVNVIIPRAGRVPSSEILVDELLTWCPVKSAEKRLNSDHIASLIADALAGR